MLKESVLPPIAIAATPAATPTTSATGRTFFAWPSLIYGQCSTLEVFLMKHRNGLARIFLGCHFYERKPARSPCSAVLHNIDRNHCTCLCEVILQIVFCCRER
jgi:hypothetical protein